MFTHEVAKHLYKQIARAIYAAWVVFTFFIGYQVFLAGAIRPVLDNTTTSVTMTRELAAKLVDTFFIILGLVLAWSMYSTICFFLNWKKGKRELTLSTLSKKIESMSLDIASIKTRLGMTEEQSMEKQNDINGQRGRVFDKQVQGVLKLSGSLKAIAKRNNGTTKAVREESSGISYSADYDKGQDREALIAKSKGRKLTKKEKEIAAVNRILPKFNQTHGTQYKIIPNQQPPDDDPADIVLIDSSTGDRLDVQVRVSDDRPWKDIGVGGEFCREGDAYETSKEAIKQALNKKLKYPTQVRSDLVFVLDGWRWVAEEHLVQFKKEEYQLMVGAGFKEIWFSGYRDETQTRLFP
ncbi:MAG: hypothetical protein MUO97_05945 [Dehalococcoidia bacterium]|nr:hypothetical protein [Dehalococcoidia bacterium]